MDDILIIGDFNADPFKGRFFNIFESQMVDHSLSFCDVIQLPASSFTYISQNSSATTSWLDHIARSNPQLVSQIKILYGDAFQLLSRVLTQKLTCRSTLWEILH